MSHFMEIKPLDSQLRARQSLPSVEIPLEIVDFDMNNPIILDPKGNYRGFSHSVEKCVPEKPTLYELLLQFAS